MLENLTCQNVYFFASFKLMIIQIQKPNAHHEVIYAKNDGRVQV